MSLLAYCVSESSPNLETTFAGLNSAVGEAIDFEGLRCFVSSLNVTPTLDPKNALHYHRILQEIFQQTAIIPFRFPTMMASRSAMETHLRDHWSEYTSTLERLRNQVQMEISIKFYNPVSHEKVPAPAKISGEEYLRARFTRYHQLESGLQMFGTQLAPLSNNWRQRGSAEEFRGFALICRDSIAEFRKTVKTVSIDSEFMARISGPWPATEFLETK